VFCAAVSIEITCSYSKKNSVRYYHKCR